MKAKDIMSVDVVSVGADEPVERAIELMLNHQISGLPVVASDGVLMGMLTEGDLMGRVELRRADTWLQRPAMMDAALQDYVKAHGMAVRDVMTKDVVIADEDTPIEELADLIARHHVKRLVIVRGEHVVGIVSRVDLIRGMVGADDIGETASSTDLRRRILNRLHVELGLPRSATDATVRDGKVILWGTVVSEEELKAARVAAESLAGPTTVVNYMRVEPARSRG